jgi:hypothetical protein
MVVANIIVSGFPHKHVTHLSHRDVVKFSRDAWNRNLGLPALRKFLAISAISYRNMRRSPRRLEQNEWLSGTEGRNRQARQSVSDEEGHGGSRQQPSTKSHKLTTSTTRVRKSSSREPAGRRTKKRPVHGRAQRQQRKLWSAEAILQEDDTRYLIKYEPVSKGAQCEISWQPKENANAALVGDWKKQKQSEDQKNLETDHGVEFDDHSQEPLRKTLLSKRHSAKPQIPLSQRADDDDLEDSPIPKDVMSITHSYNYQGPGGFHNPTNSSRRPVVADGSDSVDVSSANAEELRSSPVQAATASMPQKCSDRACAEAPDLARVNEHGLPKCSGTVLGDQSMTGNHGGSGITLPRISIASLLSPEPLALSNSGGIVRHVIASGESCHLRPKSPVSARVPPGRDELAPGAPPGKLVSATNRLEFLLGRSRKPSFL